MLLNELIKTLEAADQTLVLPDGFDSPHSYRGYYAELAFEPAHNITVGDMLAAARDALGSTYQGYKGGDYKMTAYTDCWLAEYSCMGETIGPLLLRLMLERGRPATDTVRHVYIDTEFLRNDLTERGLVSLALTDDQGVDYYAINWEMDAESVHGDDWMRENVWPFLPHAGDGDVDWKHPDVRHYGDIREQVAAYFADTTATETRLYARNGAQDAVRLHGLWGHDWTIMPEQIPRWFTDIYQLITAAGNPDGIPEKSPHAHHPLEDARHNRAVRQYLAAL